MKKLIEKLPPIIILLSLCLPFFTKSITDLKPLVEPAIYNSYFWSDCISVISYDLLFIAMFFLDKNELIFSKLEKVVFITLIIINFLLFFF